MIKKRLPNPLLFTREYDLGLSRPKGRELRTIQHWKSEMKEHRNVTSFIKVKDFKKLGIHSETGKRKGCGMY
eukprot:UN24864